MEEKFLVRVDEEYPSDHRMDVRFVDSLNVNELLARIEKLIPVSDTSVLREIKDILSDLNTAIKKTDYSGKFYEINDHIQDIKDKVNKRGEEAAEMMVALSDKVDGSNLSGTLRDLAIHVENLVQKYDEMNQKASERIADTDAMDRHIVSELETIKNSSNGVSDQKIKAINNALLRAARINQKVDDRIKEFSAYLARLNSVDYMLRLLAAKNLLKSRKKLPKWAQEKKKVLDRLILGLEEELADILIVAAVPKAGISIIDMSKAIGRTRRKTQERVVQLIAAGYVEEKKIKGRKLYFLVK